VRDTGWVGQNLRRLRIWMVNDGQSYQSFPVLRGGLLTASVSFSFDNAWTSIGSRSIFYGIWILSQVLLFAFAILHYALKDNLTAARAIFGSSYGKSTQG
jgi:hypothetical protein